MAAVAITLPAQSFEVATVKPSTPTERIIGMFTYPGGRIAITNYTLKMLIHEAYTTPEYLIDGAPAWATESRYSTTAQPPADKWSNFAPSNPKLPPPQEELLMLRALLADRFQLKTHEETKEGPVYLLEVVSPAKLKEGIKDAADKTAYAGVAYGRTGIADRPDFRQAINASMEMFAAALSPELERPVLDQTNLKGTYDFKFEYVRHPSGSESGPSLGTAIQDLGLKLVPSKGLVSRLIIDHAERPSDN